GPWRCRDSAHRGPHRLRCKRRPCFGKWGCSLQPLEDALGHKFALANCAVNVLVAFGSNIRTGVVDGTGWTILQVPPAAKSAQIIAGGIGAAGPLLGCHIG